MDPCGIGPGPRSVQNPLEIIGKSLKSFAREKLSLYYSLAAGLAPAWLGVPPPPPPPAGCLAALLVIRNAALQLYCFPAVLGYQNIDILDGFGTMKT